MSKRQRAHEEAETLFAYIMGDDYDGAARGDARRVVDFIIDAAKEEIAVEEAARNIEAMTRGSVINQTALDAAIASGNVPGKGEE